MARSFLLVLLTTACVHPPPLRAPQPVAAPPSPWLERCAPEAVLEGPLTAAWGGRACRTGPSPRFALARALGRDLALQRCLSSMGGHAAWRLRVDPAGRLSVGEVRGDAGPRRCEPLLLRHRAMALGCAWQHEFRAATFSLSED